MLAMSRIFTTTAAARMLHVDPLTVCNWVDRGFLKAYRTAGGHRRILADDLLQYLVEHQMPVPPEMGSAGKKTKLLVVDDDPPTLRAIKSSFGPLGKEVEVTTTSSGIRALILLTDMKPDAMLIDINMPGLDGFEVCREVRKYEPLSKVTLVLMTGHRRPNQTAMAREAGALACLEKPIDPNEVVTMLGRGFTGAGHT